MASVWVHGTTVPPKKVAGHLPLKVAITRFERMLADWKAQGGSAKRIDAMEAVLFDANGKLSIGLYVEPMSPPSAPEPGQPRRG